MFHGARKQDLWYGILYTIRVTGRETKPAKDVIATWEERDGDVFIISLMIWQNQFLH
jgi:hypothetical protein